MTDRLVAVVEAALDDIDESERLLNAVAHAPPAPRLEAHPHPQPGLRLTPALSLGSASPRAVLARQVASEQIEAVRELAGDAIAEEVGAAINQGPGPGPVYPTLSLSRWAP